jgi:hypothetical protein
MSFEMSPHQIMLKEDLEDVFIRLWRWLLIVLSFDAGFAAVAPVTRVRVLEACFGNDER